jgi:hypothetical protein
LSCNDSILGYNADSGLYDSIGGIQETVTTREDNCLAQAFQYLYNLITGKEKNTYVEQQVTTFKQNLK